MFCAQRDRLMASYRDSVREFVESVERLKAAERGDFVRGYSDSEIARCNCEQARVALEEHVAEHCCAEAQAGSGHE